MTERAAAGDQAEVTTTAHAGLLASDELSLEPRLEAVYREHHGFVWSSLLRLGVPASNVDDACQDVFLIVFRRLDDFEARSELRTWLFAIARRVAFRHRRGAQRAERKAKALAAEPVPVVSLEERFEKRQAAELVLEAMDALDEDKRAALVMHVLEGLSGPEVAAFLGLPVDTAYSRIKAGRRVLRARLSALGVEDDADLYASARRQTQPSRGARRRVAVLLAARLADPPALAALVWKAIAAAAVAGAIGLVGAKVLRQPPTPHPIVTTQHETPAKAPTPPPPPASAPALAPPTVATTPPPQRPLTKRRPTPHPSKTSQADRLREEVALIGNVKAALDQKRPAEAMLRLDEHARRFPSGELTLERRGYRAVALCELGKETQGRGAGRTFIKAHPGSTLAGRVRAACGLQEKARTP